MVKPIKIVTTAIDANMAVIILILYVPCFANERSGVFDNLRKFNGECFVCD